jgi:hypothetical protein
VFDVEMECFWVGIEGNINSQNFNDFTHIVKIQNCVSDKKVRNPPKNEAQRQYYKQLKDAKEKYKKFYEGNDIDMNDIISAICSKHPSINSLNVGDLTMYQLIDTYKRLSLIDEYDNTMNAMVHGASGENTELKHWISKTKNVS